MEGRSIVEDRRPRNSYHRKGTAEDKRKEDGGERETWNGCTLTVFGTNWRHFVGERCHRGATSHDLWEPISSRGQKTSEIWQKIFLKFYRRGFLRNRCVFVLSCLSRREFVLSPRRPLDRTLIDCVIAIGCWPSDIVVVKLARDVIQWCELAHDSLWHWALKTCGSKLTPMSDLWTPLTLCEVTGLAFLLSVIVSKL